uniref:FIIND domain-containing protein n=1 Tax=Strix occidentalis caurina TaxID=311401 RepID=A0A8D0F2H4_STROC
RQIPFARIPNLFSLLNISSREQPSVQHSIQSQTGHTCVAGSFRNDADDNPRHFGGPHRVLVRAPVIPPTCSARLWRPGIFRCSITGLAFVVNSAVTITYSYATWNTHLSEADQEMWVPAGPLFRIQVQQGIVHAVETLLPLLSLAGDVDTSLCSIAHFKSGKMTLEKPNRVIAFSAGLSNPNFSLLGVVWRKLRSTLNSIPVHSLVLIFHQLRAADTTLHLYLIPDDKSLKEV